MNQVDFEHIEYLDFPEGAKEPYKTKALLPKKPCNIESLRIIATSLACLCRALLPNSPDQLGSVLQCAAGCCNVWRCATYRSYQYEKWRFEIFKNGSVDICVLYTVFSSLKLCS